MFCHVEYRGSQASFCQQATGWVVVAYSLIRSFMCLTYQPGTPWHPLHLHALQHLNQLMTEGNCSSKGKKCDSITARRFKLQKWILLVTNTLKQYVQAYCLAECKQPLPRTLFWMENNYKCIFLLQRKTKNAQKCSWTFLQLAETDRKEDRNLKGHTNHGKWQSHTIFNFLY